MLFSANRAYGISFYYRHHTLYSVVRGAQKSKEKITQQGDEQQNMKLGIVFR